MSPGQPMEKCMSEAAIPELDAAVADAPVPLHLHGVALMAGAAASLAACGGGGSGPAPGAQPVTPAEAARFLAQATLGASKTDIAAAQASGFAAWIDAQFALAP